MLQPNKSRNPPRDIKVENKNRIHNEHNVKYQKEDFNVAS